jgi:ATP-binding cassette, subfamily C (CFTR/MRP), member 1
MTNSSFPALKVPPKVNVPCTESKDALFGPGISCSQFDFTLLFEQSILGIGISSLFLILALLRFWQLRGKSVKANSSWVHALKIVSEVKTKLAGQSKQNQAISLAILAVQLALLVFWIRNPITGASVPSAAIQFISALAVLFLVAFEHQRIVHPSSLLWLYLLASVVSDAVQTRTLFIRGYVPILSRLAASSLACNLALLLVESSSKKSYLKPADYEYGPEELAGIFSRSVFWWLTPILFLGNRKILKLSDLYPLDRNLRSKPLQERIIIEWEKRMLHRKWH